MPCAGRAICRGLGRTPCKPVSVPVGRRAAAIHLGRLLPDASSDLPGTQARRAAASPPIWPCSAWGLPCHPDCPGRGALLPHHFTLTPANRGGIFSAALSVDTLFRGCRPAVSRHAALRRPDFPRCPKAPRLPGRPTLCPIIGPRLKPGWTSPRGPALRR